MVFMHQRIYKWSGRGTGMPNCMRSFTQGCKYSLAQLSEKKDFGQGCGHPWQTSASRADKGIFRKVMNRRVGERRRLGRKGRGSLFSSRLMGSKYKPEPRQSGQAAAGL